MCLDVTENHVSLGRNHTQLYRLCTAYHHKILTFTKLYISIFARLLESIVNHNTFLSESLNTYECIRILNTLHRLQWAYSICKTDENTVCC